MRLPIQVLVYPVRSVGGRWEYLLLHRVSRPQYRLGCFWQGITGGVEEGEALVEAAARELAEETRLVPSTLEPIDYSYSFPVQDEWRDLFATEVEEIVEHVFLAFVGGGQEPTLSWEHDRYKWCSLDEALELLRYPGNIEALQRCERYLGAPPFELRD